MNISRKIEKDPPEEDRGRIFNLKEPKFPIVETITYKSRVPWQKVGLPGYQTMLGILKHLGILLPAAWMDNLII